MHDVVTLPDFALIVLLGGTDAERRRFAAQHFRPTEVVAARDCAATARAAVDRPA